MEKVKVVVGKEYGRDFWIVKFFHHDIIYPLVLPPSEFDAPFYGCELTNEEIEGLIEFLQDSIGEEHGKEADI